MANDGDAPEHQCINNTLFDDDEFYRWNWGICRRGQCRVCGSYVFELYCYVGFVARGVYHPELGENELIEDGGEFNFPIDDTLKQLFSKL